MASKRVFEIFFKGDPGEALGAFDKISGKAGEAEGKLGKLGTVAGATGLAIGTAAVAGAGALYKLGSDFDSVYDGIQTTTGKTGKELDGLKDSFRNVVKDVPTDFASAGTALGDLAAKTGATGKPLETLTAQALNLSRITGTDLKENVDKAAKVMNDWKLPAEGASGALDKLFKASQNTGVNFAQLSGEMDKVGPTARGMGLSFDETAGLLAQLDKAGVDSAAVFKGLTKDMVNASADVDKAQDAVGKAEKKLADAKAYAAAGHADAAAKVKAANDDLKAAQDRLGEAEDRAKAGAEGMRQTLIDQGAAIKNAKTDQEALSIAVELFGKKAGPELADAIRTGKVSLDDLTATVQGAGGAINQTATDTADGHERMQLAFNRAKIALEPLAAKTFEFAGILAEKAAPIIESVADWTATKLVPAIQDLATWIGDNVVPKLQAFAGWLNDNVLPALQAVGSWIVDNLIPALGDFAGWINDNVIPAVQAVAGFFTNTLIPAAQGVWDKLISFIGWLKDVFTGDWHDVFQGVKDFFEGIWNGFVSFLTDWLPNKLVPKLLDIAGKFMNWAKDIPGQVLSAVGDVGKTLLQKGEDLLQGLWDGAVAIFTQLIQWNNALPAAVVSAIGDVTKTLLQKGRDLIAGLWDGAKAVWADVATWIGTIASKAVTAIGDLGRTLLEKGNDLLEGFFSGVTSTWDRMKGFFSDVKDKVLGLIGNAGGWLLSTGGDLISGLLSGATSPFMAPSGSAYRFFADIPGRIKDAIIGAGNLVKDVGEKIVDWIKDGTSGAWHLLRDWLINQLKSLPGSIIGAINPFDSLQAVAPFPTTIATASTTTGTPSSRRADGVALIGGGTAVGGATAGGVTVIIQGDVYGERDFVMKVNAGLYQAAKEGNTMAWQLVPA